MTVPTLNSIAEFATNGVTTNFPFFFKFLANEDLVVTYVDPSGASSVLALGTQYTVNGAGEESGSIVTTIALAGPGQLIVSREMDAYQQTSLRNQGKFLAETHEDVFDKLTMLIQQGFSISDRALRRPYGKNYYDAEGRVISNLADPVDDQDAATKGWAGRFFGDLIDGATGLINTTTGILYDAGTLFDYLRFGVGRTVDSIAALRLLSSARNQRAFVLGYYVRGDLGGGAYSVDQADTTSADNGGTVIVAADGARWKLKVTGSVMLEQFGAKADWNGTTGTDNTAVIQAAFTAVNDVTVTGAYRVTGQLTVTNKNFMLRGSARNRSRLIWTAAVATGAIKVVSSGGLSGSSRFPFNIRDVSLCAGVANCGQALNLDYTISASGFVYTGINSLVCNNVDIRGEDYFAAGLFYWNSPCYLKNTGSVVVEGLNIIGKQGVTAGAALQIEATNGPNTSFFFGKLTVTWYERSVDIYNNTGGLYTIEGLYFTENELVGCDRGIFVRGGPVHGLRFTAGHINGETAAIQYDASARGSTACGITNNYLQIANLYSGSFKVGSVISLDVVHYSQIHDNYIAGKPSPFTVAQNGIAILSSNRCSIDGNTFVDINGSGYLIGNNGISGECVETFGGLTNTFQNVVTKKTVSGTTNGAGGASRTTSGSLDSPTGVRDIWGSSAVTLNASGDGSVTLPNGGFPNNIFAGMVCNGEPSASGTLVFSYSQVGSTKTTLFFSVRPNPGAVGVRVNYMARGD